jgi:hypothetical protein
MSAVQLTITEPSNGQTFRGRETINFRGRIRDELPQDLLNTTLYYRWYSSLFPARENRYSINQPAFTNPTTNLNGTSILDIGTHVITFATSDQPEETREAQDATRHGGVTGGAEGEEQCIINVLRANLIAPTPNASISRNNIILRARAPILWQQAEYQNLNRIRYRWRFEPRGNPPGRPSRELTPALTELTFNAGESFVEYRASLGNQIGTGAYTLTLRVEDLGNSNIGNEVSIDIQITN